MPTKLFVGNVAPGLTTYHIQELFERYGTVTECDILGSYGFVHMADEAEAKAAIEGLNGYDINGSRIKVELSTVATQGKRRAMLRPSTKIFIGNIKPGTSSAQLREIFEPFGVVTESDVVGGFGFVHMANEREALVAIKDLNGFKLNGSVLNIELSTRDTQGKAKGQDGFAGGDRTRGGPGYGPSRGRGRGGGSSRFDPYSVSGNSWLPRSEQYGSVGGMHADLFSADPYGSRLLPAPPSRGTGGASSGDESSFARELLKLYSKDPAAFDAYAHDPAVRRSLNLDAEVQPRSREEAYLKSPRDFYPEQRVQSRMLSATVLPQSSYIDMQQRREYDQYLAVPGRGLALQQGASALGRSLGAMSGMQAAMRETPAQLYMSFE